MIHRTAIAAAALLALAPAAHAFDIETPDPDLKVRLDLTPKYSMGQRLKNPSAALTRLDVAVDPGTVNEDDGDHNFNKGLISSRFDLLAELDVTAKNFGGRISASAWRDAVYLKRNDYAGTPLHAGGVPLGPVVSTANNNPGQDPNEFLPATRRQHGQGSEFLDAFVYAKGDIAGMRGTLRLGKHTLQWGESLFFGQNGIANAQGPVDIAKILSVPGWQFKEVLLPVEQVSGSLQLAEGVSLGAYYQFKWRPSKIPGVGSYFSNQDYVGTGVVNFGVDPGTGAPILLAYDAGKDLRPKDSGQGGVQLRWSPTGSEYEFGFYAAQYHDKTPAVPVFDFVNGNVHLAYAENVRTVGASVTSSIGQLNWALEGSVRSNAPLAGDPAVLGLGPILACGGKDDPCYPVGRTAHLQLSGIYVLQPGPLWGGGALVGELAYNRTLKVTKDIFAIGPGGTSVGLGGLDPNTTKGAWAFRMIFEPQYFQVLPGLDLSVPIGLGYNFGGRSSAIFNFAGGASRAGDLSVGLKGKYQNAWNIALSVTDYFGSAKTFTETLVPGSGSPRQLTYAQSLKDRSYLSFSVSRTF
jgi:hypothetical protein